MYEHVTSVSRAAYYHLKKIHYLKAFLTQEALVTIVHAFVTSCLDYCNSLLYGISDFNINRFQRIQNSVARIVTNILKYYHITPILQKVHWLPVRQRIHFKIVLITYTYINDMASEYLYELVSIRKSSRKLSHLVRYYCRCQCLGSNHMVIVRLLLQSPLRGICGRQILEMCRLL